LPCSSFEPFDESHSALYRALDDPEGGKCDQTIGENAEEEIRCRTGFDPEQDDADGQPDDRWLVTNRNAGTESPSSFV
jgi:hypothetical protein